jgi:hypothetical protein
MEIARMSDTETLERQVQSLSKELSDLRKALSEGKDVKAITPVKVDTTYLCPKDPNRQKVLSQNGFVMPDDGPLHLNGWITKIEHVKSQHNGVGPDGRPFVFETTHMVATWKCQQDGSTLTLDPYLK